jgi:hypothetical protein
VKSSRPWWTVTVVAAFFLAPARGLPAQAMGSLDIGYAGVRYDGFLPSSAGSVSPAFQYTRGGLLVAGRGSLLRFESGHQSLQGSLASSLFTPPSRIRLELSGDAGLSRYASFASFSHLLGGPRLHLTGRRQGAWIGANLGNATFGAVHRPVTVLTTGVWTHRVSATWLLTTTVTRVGDSAYTDIEGTTHYRRGPLTVDGLLGVRAWSRGGGHGVYGEASAAYRLRSWIALVMAGGRYPTDPIRGSVSGRYLSLAVRLTVAPWSAPNPSPPPRIAPQWHSPAGNSDPAPLTLEVPPCDDCTDRTLLVHTVDATSVEVSGDFTDWEPEPLSLTGPGTWLLRLPLAPGTYRFNLRIDGGEWVVPAGVTRVSDEFGGHVGVLTIQ